MSEQTAKEPCIFCKIVAKEVPSTRVFEDDKFIAFLDINPINPGHLLVIPKAHYKTITDMPKELYDDLHEVVWDLALKMQQQLDPDGIKIVQNNNEAAGQLVPHYHVHVIPRYAGDGERYKEIWNPVKINEEELKRIQEKLKI